MTRIPDPENPGEFLIECEECGNHNCEGEPRCGYCGERLSMARDGDGYRRYLDVNFRPATLTLIQTADQIITDYEAQGYTLSLRQLYYQFVSRDLIPNNDREYKKLGAAIANARLAGMISWDAIEDRNRAPNMPYINEDNASIAASLRYAFSADMWQDQPRRVEVWVEKDALSSVVGRACDRYSVPYLACKGYLSASEVYRAAMRAEEAWQKREQPTLIIHLGDHDPSGIDMTRDNQHRMDMLTDNIGIVDVRRIALNRDQVDSYKPPPNPAKITDSRAEDYIALHGRTSWELDALEPKVIEALVRDNIKPEIDPDPWNDARDRQRNGDRLWATFADNWPEIEAYIESLMGGDDG